MEEPAKGTVTSIASMFPADEAQKAAKRVDDVIEEKQELHHLKEFIADNTNLINLVSRLPKELHHDVMVPFGKAAFFPGRVIHTNEFMVLLGEGYYVERTAKQTVEILKRRGKALDSQVESLKANIKDLRAEASFFDSTASEAAEGLVEIREDYVEEISSEGQSKPETNGKKVTVEDDEYDRIMSRLDELEKEELAVEGDNKSDEHCTVESDNESDEDGHNDTVETDNESDEYEQTNAAENDGVSLVYNQTKINVNNFAPQIHSEIRKPQEQIKVQNATVEALSNKYHHQLDITDKPNCTGLMVQPMLKDDMLKSRSLTQVKKSVPNEKALLLPEVMEGVERVSLSRNEVPPQTTKLQFDSAKAFTGSIVERSSNIQTNSQQRTVTSLQAPVRTSRQGFDSSKAFTGSIVEHTHDVQTSQSQLSNSQPSKLVSRFKMQRK